VWLDSDHGREIIYKMCQALNLSVSKSRTKVSKIQKVRPFEEIATNRIKKQVAYEEFWTTDFELAHMNK